MSKSFKFNSGNSVASWNLMKKLGKGGHGTVWKALNEKDGRIGAIKILMTGSKNKYLYARFRDEIAVVIKNQDMDGILPIIDSSLPEDGDSDLPWYVMPVAIPLIKILHKKQPEEIIKHICHLFQVLAHLHERQIYHRDIKPPNLFYFNSFPCFGDFGLVDFPGKDDLTQPFRKLGPRWTIAPEMLRNPESAEGGPADVYSLAKTLWIFLSKQKKGFDGQYVSDSVYALSHFVPTLYTTPLDGLLAACTDPEPKKRPTALEVVKTLKEWEVVQKNFFERNPKQWIELIGRIFPKFMPDRAIWTNIEAIVAILNEIASVDDDLVYVLLAGGGGNTLKGARISYESGCIELHLQGIACVVKPQRLIFELFSSNLEWSYFRLETGELELFTVLESSQYEYVTELSPCSYTDYDCWEFNDYNSDPLPPDARCIGRFRHGSFVGVPKISPYNLISSTHDGRHDKMDTEKFRSYISGLIERSEDRKSKQDLDNSVSAPKFIKPTHVRQGRSLTENEVNLITKIIGLARERDNENSALTEEKNSDGYEASDTFSWFERTILKPAPKRVALIDFLENLSYEEKLIALSVMYGGRDLLDRGRPPTLEEMIEYFSESDMHMISLVEKAALVEYLEAGLTAYAPKS